MASFFRFSTPCILFLSILLCTTLVTSTDGAGRKVGGRMEVKDVESNREVQELGEYCVQEYNARRSAEDGDGHEKLLVFRQVVQAEKQVVAGLKYYLKIVAAEPGGQWRFFDAAVVVKPWLGTRSVEYFSPHDM